METFDFASLFGGEFFNLALAVFNPLWAFVLFIIEAFGGGGV